MNVAADRRTSSGTAAVAFSVFAALGPLLMVALYGIGPLLPIDDVGTGVLLALSVFLIELILSPASAIAALILAALAWRAGSRRQVAVTGVVLGAALVLLIVQLILYRGFLG